MKILLIFDTDYGAVLFNLIKTAKPYLFTPAKLIKFNQISLNIILDVENEKVVILSM